MTTDCPEKDFLVHNAIYATKLLLNNPLHLTGLLVAQLLQSHGVQPKFQTELHFYFL